MPPIRRSARLKWKDAQLKCKEEEAMAAEEARVSAREKKRREAFSEFQPSADEDVLAIARGIWFDNSKLQLEATTQLLKLVSFDDNPLIDQVIQTGAVSRLVEFLTRVDYPELQCEAARVLKNIAGGTSENTKKVVECGAVPVFVKLLLSSQIYEQVTWALGNIAGDSPECRDIVISCGALSPLLTLLNKHTEPSFLRIGTWALSNFLEGKPEVPHEQLKPAIPILSSLILSTDEVVLKETCWAMLYLSQFGGGIVSAMYEADLCMKLTQLFLSHSSVILPAIRTITSIVEGAKTLLDDRAGVLSLRIRVLYTKDMSPCILKVAQNLGCFLNENQSVIDNAMTERWLAAKNITR